MKKVTKGDKVKVNYTGALEDGTVFDTSEGKQPLEFEAGSRQLIKGFDEGIMGMEKNEEKEINITPSEAYGDIKPELLKKIPRSQLPKESEPKTGMTLLMKTPDGKQFPAKITEVGDSEITIDLNHPLAGKTLNFKVKILEIN